ncbi:MAG: hypothetical protein WCT49_03715 [Candidatus Paceibacterota bacterium]|jgi:hypothetical protein
MEKYFRYSSWFLLIANVFLVGSDMGDMALHRDARISLIIVFVTAIYLWIGRKK